jgi:hypothetical protein
VVKGVLDYESATSHDVVVRTTTDAGQTADHALTVTIGGERQCADLRLAQLL